MDIPVELVFVRSVEGTRYVNVNWFSLADADFRLSKKHAKFVKHWTDPNWMKKEKLKPKEMPTTAQIFKYWSADKQDRRSIVPISIPVSYYTTDKVIQKDTFMLPTDFITNYLIPFHKSLPVIPS